MMSIITEYWDILIALAFLIGATFVLPGRMRWYVLTFGLAYLGHDVFLRLKNKKALAEADNVREELRAKATELSQKSSELKKEIERLNADLVSITEKEKAANVDADRLRSEGEQIRERLIALEQRIEDHRPEEDAVLSRLDRLLDTPAPPQTPN